MLFNLKSLHQCQKNNFQSVKIQNRLLTMVTKNLKIAQIFKKKLNKNFQNKNLKKLLVIMKTYLIRKIPLIWINLIFQYGRSWKYCKCIKINLIQMLILKITISTNRNFKNCENISFKTKFLICLKNNGLMKYGQSHNKHLKKVLISI